MYAYQISIYIHEYKFCLALIEKLQFLKHLNLKPAEKHYFQLFQIQNQIQARNHKV